MNTAVDAIYENGLLRPLAPLPFPEHTRVHLSVEPVANDAERASWIAQSERSLTATWDNDADDVFNELLS